LRSTLGSLLETIVASGISAWTQMAAELKKEIELEIVHVLFTAIVGYSKLRMDRPFQTLCGENSK